MTTDSCLKLQYSFPCLAEMFPVLNLLQEAGAHCLKGQLTRADYKSNFIFQQLSWKWSPEQTVRPGAVVHNEAQTPCFDELQSLCATSRQAGRECGLNICFHFKNMPFVIQHHYEGFASCRTEQNPIFKTQGPKNTICLSLQRFYCRIPDNAESIYHYSDKSSFNFPSCHLIIQMK